MATQIEVKNCLIMGYRQVEVVRSGLRYWLEVDAEPLTTIIDKQKSVHIIEVTDVASFFFGFNPIDLRPGFLILVIF